MSLLVGEDYVKRYRFKVRSRRFFSDCFSSYERVKRKKVKDKSGERRRVFWGRGRYRFRFRSGSFGSFFYDYRESRRKKKRELGFRFWGRECSFFSSLERVRRYRYLRERSRERFRDRRGFRERKKRKCRLLSVEFRFRERRRFRFREKRLRFRFRFRFLERKLVVKEVFL